MKIIEGAGHYYKGQPEQMAEAVVAVTDWLGRQGLVD